jgi:16S rRNA A1518/A1519 N6-dimethyltransferase RsmA/KsgA/DIM1 with predicted DNA glycosylase/AP lyase activity
MKNKNRGFDNSLYAEAADAYHAFVRHYNLEPFLTRLHQQFNSMGDERKCTLLELGAGTGVFTVPLSTAVNGIDAVEYSENQIHILEHEIAAQGIEGVNVIHGDANEPESLGLRQAYDIVLFTFSLDNISNASVYEALS